MSDPPSGWAQSPRLLAGTLLEMASFEARTASWYISSPSKTLTQALAPLTTCSVPNHAGLGFRHRTRRLRGGRGVGRSG